MHTKSTAETLLEKKLLNFIAVGPLIFIPFVVILILFFVIRYNQLQLEQSVKEITSSYINTQKSISLAKVENAAKLIEYKRSMTKELLREKVKTRVESAYAVAKNIYAQNKAIHTDKEIQKMIIDSLRPLLWNRNESFIFILDHDGVFYLAPDYLRHLEGKSIIDFQDATGRYVIREEIALVKTQGEGALWDTFIRPGYDPDMQFEQLAYVKDFGAYNWYFGSSEYLDTMTKEMEKEAVDLLRNLSKEKSSCFFIMNEAGDVIMHGHDASLEGKNALAFKDANGRAFVEEMIENARSGKLAFVDYKWENPETNVIEHKNSVSRKVPNSDWIVGSGFCMDELDTIIASKKEELYEKNNTNYRRIVYFSTVLLLFSVLLSYKISMMLRKRLSSYAKTVEAKNRELTELNQSLEKKVYERTEELHDAYIKMKHLAVTDTLTGIYNRYYFNTALEKEIYRAHRYERSFALLMFDLDHFKKINDTYGHAIGDMVLLTLSNLVVSCLRESDIFARIGGEEFIIILPETGEELSLEIAERIRKNIESYSFEPVKKVTISIGLVRHKSEEGLEELLRRVDSALYEAKNSGRNRVIVGD
ncbi:MAG: cache domain-containing protein [Campylobacterales bacterium]|nr:cache domain-containing protein [Campylobacterales bacterium]